MDLRRFKAYKKEHPVMVFVDPPYESWPYLKGIMMPNAGLLSVASWARKCGAVVHYIDANSSSLTWKKLLARIRELNPDIVLTTAVSRVIYEALYLVTRTREILGKNVLTVLGDLSD